MYPGQRQRKVAARGIEKPLAVQQQQQLIEDCIDSLPERCQARTQHVPLILLDRARTHRSADTRRSEVLRQC